MPLTAPAIDTRKYQDLLNEALARIPVHNPEWTNFNRSDPGVTLIELFAFLTENLLYRSNLIPERNRLKFLSLLGVPLRPASSARGLVTFTNERGPLQTLTLNAGLEVRAGQVPFRTEQGLDVLPVEASVLYKKKVVGESEEVRDYYEQLYASFETQQTTPASLLLYQTVPLTMRESDEVDLGADTVDGSLWIALMVRAADKPYDQMIEDAREALGGKTLSLGLVPSLANAARTLLPGGVANAEATTLLQYSIPKMPADGMLEKAANGSPLPRYQRLLASSTTDVLNEPGVVQLTLPPASELRLWDNLDPLEAGVGDLPPALEDTDLSERVITWIRVRSTAAVQAKLLWVGINATTVTQRARVTGELLPSGTGEPDQSVILANTPVIPKSVELTVTVAEKPEPWQETDDLLSAGPEVPVPDSRQPPGAQSPTSPLTNVFKLDPESGEIRFGDGTHGRRPPLGAGMRAAYDYSVGDAGNVGAGSISTGAALPAGVKVTNPLRTWGGARAETVAEGERQVARYLQHRDRLVTQTDFETITLRTPGVDIGRVEVIPAFSPELAPNEPGDAPGAVTLMIIPRYDPVQPDAPVPDRLFLDSVCDYLDERRLVTTEVYLRGPVYKGIWVTIGINVIAGMSVAEVREAVKSAVLQFLAPLPEDPTVILDTQAGLTQSPQYADMRRGWPLRKSVTDRELLAVASRVAGVLSVNNVFVAEGTRAAEPQITMAGLELPRVLGISVAIGEPVSLDELRGQGDTTGGTGTGGGTGGGGTGGGGTVLPVPTIPEEC
ncbi:MAG TPA: baseplate J/gp47 family protein [Pyrinomonadaceae bacterium]|nr:baseplate J/gp47 family protein [Pyrinomonadaceae bacterium]